MVGAKGLYVDFEHATVTSSDGRTLDYAIWIKYVAIERNAPENYG